MKHKLPHLLSISLLLGLLCTFFLAAPASASGQNLPPPPCGTTWGTWMPDMIAIPNLDHTQLQIGEMTGLMDTCGNKIVLGITPLNPSTIDILAWGSTGGYYESYGPPDTRSFWSDIFPPNVDHACVYVLTNSTATSGTQCFP